MKASVQYNDFEGTAAADISDRLGGRGGDDLQTIGKYFGLDQDRFKIVAISIYGTENFYISLVCVDNDRSSAGKEHIVKMSYNVENKKNILEILFKRLHIVLHDKFDEKYRKLDYDEEVNFDDFHGNDEDEA